jgi:Predicted acyltransferases
MKDIIPKRFYSLDALRGLAAFAVVIYHWPQFFFSGNNLRSSFRGESSFIGTYDVEKLPFFKSLFIFYDSGWLAVDLFFGLSGFIFYWLYSSNIKNSAITTWEFLVARFSRLYPLHMLTLIWVVSIQLASQHIPNTRFYFYQHNNIHNFILNLFLTSSWGFGDWHSFNTPIWSVSVEVALYIIFFVCCRLLSIHNFILFIFSAAGLFIIYPINHQLGHGVFSFFLGGCTYRIYVLLVSTSRTRKALPYLSSATLSMWFIAIFLVYHQCNPLDSAPFFWRYTFLPAVFMFQMTILTLAVAETRRGTMGKRISYLGDISYSVYLLHFPIQLSTLTTAIYLRVSREVFYNYYVFFCFFVLLLIASIISHYYFERPAQNYIRKTWVKNY